MESRQMTLEKTPHPIHLQYSFPPYPGAELKTIQVDLAEGALLLDAIRHCREEHHVPIYLEESLLSTVQDQIHSTRRARVQQEIERVDREVFATPETTTTTTEPVKGENEAAATTSEDASTKVEEDQAQQVQTEEAPADGSVQKQSAAEAELLKAMIENYRNHTTEFYTQPEENMFPEAYHTLVHSPVSGLFDAILDLEREYAGEVNALLSARDAEIDAIQAKHNLALQSENPQRGMTHLVTRHIERLDVAQATWNSQLDDLQTAQRAKYQEFILELYSIYRRRQSPTLKPAAESSREGSVNGDPNNRPEPLDGKAMVALAMKNVGARKSNVEETPALDTTNKNLPPTPVPSDPVQSQSVETTNKNDEPAASHSNQSETATSTPAAAAAAAPEIPATTRPEPPRKEDEELNKMIQSILEMGFDEEQAKGALLISNRNMDHAITLLLEQPENIPRLVLAKQKVDAMKENARQKSRTQSSPQRPLPSLTGASGPSSGAPSSSMVPSQQHQQQPIHRGHASNRSLDRSSSFSTPRPLIGFLQQQKNALLTNNSSPSVKKFGGWLNKAIENLGLDDDMDSSRSHSTNTATPEPQQPQPASNLAESFTVVLGSSHSKVTHNFRLVVSDPAEVFPSHRVRSDRDMAIQAQTAASLYGQNLSGLVQLVNIRDWGKYKSGQVCHQEFFKACQTSTELHFDSIEKQLEALEEDFPLDGSGLREGDFVMTRHSNLPMIHVVFHLFYGQTPASSSSDENGEGSGPTSSTATSSFQMPLFSQPGDFVLKHDFLAGLRNIIRTAHRYEITMLSLPFMMLPSTIENQMMSPSPYLSTGGTGGGGGGGNGGNGGSGGGGAGGGAGSRLSQSAMTLSTSSSTVVGSNMPSAGSSAMSSSVSSSMSTSGSSMNSSSTGMPVGKMTTTIYMTEPMRRELLRRTEVLMRHWKANLMESARQVKQVGNQGNEAEKFRASQGGDVKVIQFLLPRTTNDDMFRMFRMVLVNVFGGV